MNHLPMATKKLCINCRYMVSIEGDDLCYRPVECLVRGSIPIREACRTERRASSFDVCGPKAKYFMAK